MSSTRNPWACQPCRRLKVRCFPSEQSDICKKCLGSGATCVFDERPPVRKRRRVTASALVRSLEARIDGLQARVDEHRPDVSVGISGGVLTPDSLVQQQQFWGDVDVDVDVRCTLQMPTYMPTPTSTATDWPVQKPVAGPAGADNQDDLISLDLSDKVIISSLSEYHKMSTFFPFVVLAPDTTPPTMRRDHPFLLHAITAVTTARDLPRQKSLEITLRKTLLQKIMLDSCKSLDLLQALLVYVAWYHFFFIPKKEQSYQLLQMAIGMAVDLGLDLAPKEALSRGYGLKLDHYHPKESGEWYSADARRAWLGCYYLSTNTAWVWGKKETMGYSGYMAECALSLAQEGSACKTDRTLWGVIRTHAVGQQYYDMVRDKRGKKEVEEMLEMFHEEIVEIEKRVKENAGEGEGECILFTMARHHATAHVHEMDLLNPFVPSSPCPNHNQHSDSEEQPLDKISLLTTCLLSTKFHLDAFLSIPSSEYTRVTSVPWSSLVYSVAALYRLSLGTRNILEWERERARKEIRLEVYLDAICFRLQGVVKMRRGGNDLFSVLGLIFENVRATFERLVQLPMEEARMDGKRVHRTTFPIDELGLSEQSDDDRNVAVCPVEASPESPAPAHHRPEAHYNRKCPAFQWWGWGTPSHTPSTATLPTLSASTTTVSTDFWPSVADARFQ